jgi:hypothetical protein
MKTCNGDEGVAGEQSALSAVLRLKAGLSPLQRLEELTIDFETHRQFVIPLLGNSIASGNKLGIVVGPYGCGKSHFLQIARRLALANNFAVAQLNLDTGLGSLGRPQQHVFNLITSLVFPHPHGEALEWLADSLRHTDGRRALAAAFKEVQPSAQETADTALRIIREVPAELGTPLLLDYLSGALLVAKTAHPSTRMRTYELVRFWSAIAHRILGFKGVLIIVDELENLFSNALYPSVISRQRAYRTLSHYTEMMEPAATLCALTPAGWQSLVAEVSTANGYLSDAPQLAAESISRLFGRVLRTKPYELVPLSGAKYKVLFERLSRLHAEARAYPRHWMEDSSAPLAGSATTPRIFSKTVISTLESAWFRRKQR